MIITRYCTVRFPDVRIDGKAVYTFPGDDPSEFLKTAYRGMGMQYPKFFKMDNLCKLAFLASEALLRNQGVSSRCDERETGLVLQNSSSSLETDEKHQESISDRANYFPSPSVFVYTLPNIMVGEICIRHRIKGENAVLISEKADPEQLFDYVHELFTRKRVQCCITGWVEAYRQSMSAVLAVVEKEEMAESCAEPREMIIFDPLNLERILKEA
jgi:hypothetical protein